MLPYSILFVLIILILLISRKEKSGLTYFLCFLVLLVFSGFRFNVGTDYNNYVDIFADVIADRIVFIEPFSLLIIQSIAKIGGNYQLLFLFYALIILTGIFHFVKKVSCSKELSLYIFFTIGIFFLSTLNIIRQWAAVSMMLYAIVSLLDKKYLKTCFYILIAILFHMSALILVLLPLLVIRFQFKTLLFLFTAISLAASSALTILNISRYSVYLNELKFENKGSPTFIFLYILFMVFIIIYSGYFKQNIILKRSEIVMLNMCLVSMYILALGYALNMDFLTTMRVNIYFQIQLIILIPWFIFKIKNIQLRHLALISIVLFCSVYFFMLLYNKGVSDHLTPYMFNFNISEN